MTGIRCVLAVKNLRAASEFYEMKLGFKSRWADEGWHCLAREKFVVMLGECVDEKPARDIGDHSYFGYIEVKNINALYQEYKDKGVEIISQLQHQPWGQKEFGIRTIDGHRIMFGETIQN